MSLELKAILALVIAGILSAMIFAFGEHRYHAGEAHTQAAWDAEKLAQTRTAFTTSEKYRGQEDALRTATEENAHALADQLAATAQLAQDRKLALDDRDRRIDGLRHELTAGADRGATAQDPAAAGSCNGAREQLRGLLAEGLGLGQSAGRLLEEGRADLGRTEDKLAAMQRWGMDLRHSLDGGQ